MEKELVEYISERFDGKETVEIISDLIKKIEDNPRQFTVNLSNAIEEYADEMNICPICGNEIILLDTYEEDRGEFQGFPATETIYKVGCESSTCGYTKE